MHIRKQICQHVVKGENLIPAFNDTKVDVEMKSGNSHVAETEMLMISLFVDHEQFI